MTRNTEVKTEILHPGNYWRGTLTLTTHDDLPTTFKFYSRSFDNQESAANWITTLDSLLKYGALEISREYQL